MIPNRMRSSYALIEKEFGKGNVPILEKWEKLEKKIIDFQNQRRSTLRCLGQNITLTSIKLKSNINTPWGANIIRKVEKQLMNKRVRSFNSTTDSCTKQRDACRNDLKDDIDNELYKECSDFIKRVRESRHTKILDRQKNKFNRLC